MERLRSLKGWVSVRTIPFPMACNGCIHVRSSSHSVLLTLLETDEYRTGGGMPMTQNRTLWPVTGGAVAAQPGWFQGHATAYFYINLGIGNMPLNMSLPMVPVFQITGPTKQAYPGGFCLPQVPLPAGISPQIGDNATIQVVETAVHGAALYSVCSSTQSAFSITV
jgi:hypothetical protein